MQTILIAGNDRKWLNGLAGHLLETGFRAELANGGVECIAQLRAGKPDGLIVDADLLWGGLDGVLEFLREEYSDSNRLALVVIGGIPVQSQAGQVCRRQECLPKPIDSRTIVRAVARITTEHLSLSHF